MASSLVRAYRKTINAHDEQNFNLWVWALILMALSEYVGRDCLRRGVCVCVSSSYFSFWTSSSLDAPAGVTQEEGHTGFFIHLLSAVRALSFFARRIQPFLSLVDREVDFFCVLTI